MVKMPAFFGLNLTVNNESDTGFISSRVFVVHYSSLIGWYHGPSFYKLDACHVCIMAVVMPVRDRVSQMTSHRLRRDVWSCMKTCDRKQMGVRRLIC